MPHFLTRAMVAIKPSVCSAIFEKSIAHSVRLQRQLFTVQYTTIGDKSHMFYLHPLYSMEFMDMIAIHHPCLSFPACRLQLIDFCKPARLKDPD